METSEYKILDQIVSKTRETRQNKQSITTITNATDFIAYGTLCKTMPENKLSSRKKGMDDLIFEEVFDEIRFYFQVFCDLHEENGDPGKIKALRRRLLSLVDILEDNINKSESLLLHFIKSRDIKTVAAAFAVLYTMNIKIINPEIDLFLKSTDLTTKPEFAKYIKGQKKLTSPTRTISLGNIYIHAKSTE